MKFVYSTKPIMATVMYQQVMCIFSSLTSYEIVMLALHHHTVGTSAFQTPWSQVVTLLSNAAHGLLTVHCMHTATTQFRIFAYVGPNGVTGQNRVHKTATIKTAPTKPCRLKSCKAQNCADHNCTGHNCACHITEILCSSWEWFPCRLTIM